MLKVALSRYAPITTKHAHPLTSFQFDAEAVAQELGMKDAGSVKARWNTINRKKIQGAASPAGGVDKTTPTKKVCRDSSELSYELLIELAEHHAKEGRR